MFVIRKIVILLLLVLGKGLWTCYAESTDHLKPGDQLDSSSPELCSAGGTYCIFFARIATDLLTYLVISNAHTETVVWNANRNEPLFDSSTAALTLDHSGALKITRQGEGPIILYSSAQPQSTINNTMATLLETGNFVLQQLHPSGSKSVLWQSFDHPTDTLIPGMRLGFNHKTGQNLSLIANFLDSSPAAGHFTLEWEPKQGQLIIRRRGQVYWASGVLRDGKFKNIAVEAQCLYNYTIVSNKDEEYFTFATWDDKGNAIWSIDSTGRITDGESHLIASVDKCYGYNSDRGCQLWDQPPCRHEGEFFNFTSVGTRDQVITYNSDDNAALSNSDCKATCWSNCRCVGFTNYHPNETGCSFYYENSQLNIHGDDVLRINLLVNRTYKGYPTPTPAPSPGPMGQYPESNAGTKNIKWLIAVITTALFIICALILWLLLKRRKLMLQGKDRAEMEYAMIELETSNGYKNHNHELQNYKKNGHDLRVFSYASIVEATNGFSSQNKLGEGGFGPVYKGKLQMGKDVAVKRLSRSSRQGVIEFKNELKFISKLQHMNLVQLLGCCIHGNERILIYEYMPNKSLDHFLFDSTRSNLLDWTTRFNIIEGIAQGLLYLHKYSRLRVVHRDLKASNILLDESMSPKISDFGLARIITQESKGSTQRIVGTYGYMPPEYAMEGIFSIKSDVYSFGILMLEIVSGRRNTSFYDENCSLNLVGHAWELWKDSAAAALELVDPGIKDSFVQDQVLRCIHVGLLCAEEQPADRPTMVDILSLLTNESANLPLLKKPAFCSVDRARAVNQSHERQVVDSANGLSISDLFAR